MSEPRRRARRRRLGAVAVAAVLAAAMSACANVGLQPAPPAPAGYIRELVLPSENGNAVQDLVNFNPYGLSPTTSQWLYEPLMLRDQYTCAFVPWLATGYRFVSSTELVITIRQGVKWTDGTAFSAKDVAFTFNAAKQYPGMDRAGLWTGTYGSTATSVTAVGDTVVIRTKGSAAAKIEDLLQLTRILPEHVYSKVGDITKYIDEKPVSTGPFVVQAYNGRRLELARNPGYWQASKVKVNRLALEGSYDTNSAALKLRTGALDLYQGDIPNPVASVRRAGVTDFQYAPAGTTVLAPNNQKAPLNDVKLREAMAYAIDKEAVSRNASFGVMKPASQTMLKLPVQQDALPAEYRKSGGYVPYSPKKAEQLLDAAGYRKGADGFRTTPQGKPISLVFSVQAGFIDYLAMSDVVTRDLNAVGIRTKQVVTDPGAVDSVRKTGDFDLAIDYVGGTCSRAKDLGGHIQSANIPQAKDAAVNLNTERFSDRSVDALVSKYLATTDAKQSQQYLSQVIDVYTKRFPVIALQYAPQRIIYNTQIATGWPTNAADSYPADQLLYVLVHLRAKG